MATHTPKDDPLAVAANLSRNKLRLARLGAAINTLQAIPTSAGIEQHQHRRHLVDLQHVQQLALDEARQHIIALSRIEATQPGGIPNWHEYMNILLSYRHHGHAVAHTQPDSWRDQVLESIEATYNTHSDTLSSCRRAIETDDSSIGSLSPACAEHLLLFEESQVATSVDISESPSSNGYDTDPGTPYISSEPGTETESVSSGPMSPTDDFAFHELPSGLKSPSPFVAHPPVHILHRHFLAPAEAPKSRPFSYEDILALYDIFDKTGIEYYIFERKRDPLHHGHLEVKSCQKVDLLTPFVQISRRFARPTTHTQIPLEILLRMSRVIVNSFAWPQPGETWREFLGVRTERYRREKEQLDAQVPPELRRAEHADFCYSFMRTVTEYIGSNPAILDSVIDATRLRENEKWDYVLAYRCIWENLGLLRFASPHKAGTPPGSLSRARGRSHLANNQHGFVRLASPHAAAWSAHQIFV